MPRFERSVTVNVPVERAFEYLADISRHGDWSTHGLEVKKTSDGPLGAGSTFASVGHQLGTHQGEVTITEFVPNQHVVYESRDDTGQFRHDIAFRAQDGSTQVTKGVEPLKTGFALTLARPFMGLIIPRSIDGDLQRIKRQLETAQ